MKRNVCFTAITILALMFACITNASAQKDRAQLEKEIESLKQQIEAKEKETRVLERSLREQIREKEKMFLSASDEDNAKYADYLNRLNRGIVRLMPRETYSKKLTLREGGAYYSFAGLTHEYNYVGDICLQGNRFITGFAGANFGFIGMLGDVPLESVSVDSPGVEIISNYSPPEDEPGAREEQKRSHEGFKDGAVEYKRDVPALVAKTYVMRAVDYQASDSLVAFRVVRKDADGSLILIWKMLKRYPAPRLDRIY